MTYPDKYSAETQGLSVFCARNLAGSTNAAHKKIAMLLALSRW